MTKRLNQGGPHCFRFFDTYYTTSGGNNYFLANSPFDGSIYGNNFSGNYIYASPFYLGRDFFLYHYGFIVTEVTTSGTSISWGIYIDNWADLSLDVRYPGKKIAQSNTTITNTGFYYGVCSPSLFLKGNRIYWAVFSLNTTGSQKIAYGVSYLNLLGHNFTYSTYPGATRNGFSKSRTHTDTLPDTFPSGGQYELFLPLLLIREVNQNGN